MFNILFFFKTLHKNFCPGYFNETGISKNQYPAKDKIPHMNVLAQSKGYHGFTFFALCVSYDVKITFFSILNMKFIFFSFKYFPVLIIELKLNKTDNNRFLTLVPIINL